MADTSSVALLLALLSALLAPAAPHQYTTTLEKSLAPAEPAVTGSFSIPAGQCTGYIGQSLLCGAARAAAVRVRVRDSAFAALRIGDALRSATVTRARCAGVARVQLSVACAARAPAP